MDTSVKPCLVARAMAWDVGADMEIKVPAPKIAALSTICVVFLNIACSGLRRLGGSCVVVRALRYSADLKDAPQEIALAETVMPVLRRWNDRAHRRWTLLAEPGSTDGRPVEL
jgi:hypothetical protein